MRSSVENPRVFFPKETDQKKYPYEIHVTVPAGTTDLGRFRAACGELQVKPIVLDLEINRGNTIKDVMTSSTLMGSDANAFAELSRISDGLEESGFQVIRKKIETAPWHPAAPSRDGDVKSMPEGSYFECHFGVNLSPNERGKLDSLVEDMEDIGKLHISKNAFKQFTDNVVIMATYRAYDGISEEFQTKVGQFSEKLSEKFTLDKVITEFALYDNKIDHDTAWIESTPCSNCVSNCSFEHPLFKK